ncbi:PREDICTED: single myb histone 5-like isoform X2 [Nelumbo nucifera]|uniref:Single myb histone 5-like isoform X2 n=1 Tax=Nelumbo nucifera TaxID=4432 RepID=A0A1U7YY85_NELNU|nr:PREDICTED: single myb histone 5-like isoform X2 [Nelumbo nucifera]
MGAPKQKWTPEEEAALRAGIAKHGPGKWKIILRDPEFSHALASRSNVDLKDKYRNVKVMENGGGSRERARLLMKWNQQIPKHDDYQKASSDPKNDQMASSTEIGSIKDEIIDAKPLAISGPEKLAENSSPLKNSISRLEDLILEAVAILKERNGSNKSAIATYIEEKYCRVQKFNKVLSMKLNALVSSGKLIKVNRKYRLPSSQALLEERKPDAPLPPCPILLEERKPGVLLLEGRPIECKKIEEKDVKPLTKFQIDAELQKMRNMTAEEVAAAAAKAVAEAEAAMAEAEAAAREAEMAEADAEAAQAFAEAARLTLKNLTASAVGMVHG